MKVSAWIATFGCLIALALLLHPGDARAVEFNARGCGWPLVFSPEGSGNVQGPDGAARYWIMPFDTRYEKMTIKGTYPKIRYFAITAYETLGYDAEHNTNQGFHLVEQHLYDAQIAPDPGSSNPFVPPGGRSGTYTVVISRSDPSSGNTIKVSSDLVWVVLRMYVPNADPALTGKALMGGVPLPTITLTDGSGTGKQLDTCQTVNKWGEISALAQLLFPLNFDPKVIEGTPATDRLWFASPANPPSILWPNPDGKYMMMWPGDEYQPGRVIVIHGKAPGVPDTFNGAPIWEPSRGFRSVDMRYWALCEQDFAVPLSLIGCATDLTTRLEGGYYTIVISDDRQRPGWLSPNINWLPYGDEQYPKFLVLRNTLVSDDFHYAVKEAWARCPFDLDFKSLPDRSVLDEKGPCSQDAMGDYYPVAVWCDKATFMHGGWQACMKER
ncbi:hypothetical protein [Geomonas edaphica]|uniref:hypothetical protein n=1 Tax=Geomonas edaphica TaxID=2570226 RepID=UPI0010A85091|nr:hypothetical protein [Geomonas edaphica]